MKNMINPNNQKMVKSLNNMKKKKVIISNYNHENTYFAVAFSENHKIVRIALPQNSLEEVVSEISKYHPKYCLSNENKETARKLCQIYNGEKLNFDLKLLELDLSESSEPKSTIKTSFERDVILEVAKIPYGSVKTYKEIAKSLNSHAYRAVGTAIGKNPFPIIIPCHRVIRSDGKIGGFRGGTPMKIEILKNEGIKIEASKIKVD
jgi:methylated-DNA-[protein]-cysteine S-methyltransferase